MHTINHTMENSEKRDRAIRSFNHHSIDYLLKPTNEEDVIVVARERTSSFKDWLDT